MGKILLKQEMRETIGTEGKVGGNSSLLVHSGPQLSCGERENKGANKTSKRKSWAHSSNSNRGGNWWLVFLLRDRYLKQCWAPAFAVSFFAQLLEGICAGSCPGPGKEPTRELCSLPPLSSLHRALNQTSPENTIVAGTDSFGEASPHPHPPPPQKKNQAISLPQRSQAFF